MADKKTEVSKEETIVSSGLNPPSHEDSKADNHDKKKVTTDTECGSTIEVGSSQQDKQNTVEETRGSIDDEFSLQLESSDEETLKDDLDSGEASKSGVKPANSNKSETLFSDIESSDDSIVYEPKIKEDEKQSISPVDALPEVKKVIESEFEPVESEEEFFEDSLPDRLEPISKEERKEEEETTTPLINEENNVSAGLNLNSEEDEAAPASLKTESNLESIGSPPDIDLMLESLVDTEDEIASNEEKTANNIEITTSQEDSVKDEEIDDSPNSPKLVPDPPEETVVVPSSSLLIEKKEKYPKSIPDSHEADMNTSESSKQQEDKKSCQELKEDPETAIRIKEYLISSKFLESPVPHDLESTPSSPKTILENELLEEIETEIEIKNEVISKETKEKEHDPEKIEMSSENKDTDQSVQGEKIVIYIKTTSDDDEKMEEIISSHEVSDIFASENENPDEEEEPMQVDETILEASGISEMKNEANEDDVIAEKTDNLSIENKILQIYGQNVAEDDEQLMEEPNENEAAESSETVKHAQPAEAATSQDLIEIEKEEKSDKSPTPCESIDIQETKSPKASTDEEIKEPTQNQEDVVELSDMQEEILEKTDDVVESQKEVPVDFEKSPEKSPEAEIDNTEATTEIQTSIIDVTSPLKTTEKSNQEFEKLNKPSTETIKTLETTEEKAETSQTKQQTAETVEPIMETAIAETDVHDSDEKSSEEESNKQVLQVEGTIREPSESETDPTEKQNSQKEYNEPASLEAVVNEIETEKDSSKKSEETEAIKTCEIETSSIETVLEPVETPEVAAEVVVKIAVESKNLKKPPAKVYPEVIEIDDDDEIEEAKKIEDKAKLNEKVSPSTNDKESQDKKTDEVTITPLNKETKEPVTPMEVDQEIRTEKPVVKNQISNMVEESITKDDDAQVLDDEDEPLLMIDTSHKEDNDMESNLDNETATSAPTTDSSSEGSLEVFYDKECVNYECKRASKNFYRATVFAMNYFKVSKKRTKTQFVCEDCYDRSLGSYEDLCKTLKMKQPLLHGTTFKCQEFVEIIDSSDEEDSDSAADKVKVSDENTLPKESIEMLEAELEGAIRKVMHNVDIQKQLSWTKQILQQRLTNLEEDSDFVTEQLRALQRKADHMHNSLYQCPKIKLRQLTPLDLNSGRMYNPEADSSSNIPLPGDIIRNPICVNEQYYAVKTKAIASWVPCKVIEEVEGYPTGYSSSKTYKIKFTKLAKYPMFKTVYAKHMAYFDPPNVRLPIGSRVIAYFDATSLSRGKEKMLIPSAFYPGIIAEPLKQSNKFRYLVFYDDGYFQYVNHKDVRLVCQASENVWEDVHHQSREFIHNYLTQYAVNRPMVQTQKGQSMLVDYNGKWIYARVIDVDCSLVQMLFEGQSRSEWIYRGSTRLGPVYKESNNLSQKNTLNATRRRTEPFIRYFNGDDSSTSQQVQETEQPPQAKAGTGEIRSVAKKSVSRVDNSNNNNSTTGSAAQPVPTVRHLNNSTIFVDDDNKPKGKVVYYTARKNLPPRNYVPHICNPSCPFNITHNLSFYSPLAKPLLSGWERQVFRQKSKKFIIYRGPCGKRMRNIEELHRYLRVTDNELNVDNFDFSPDTNCLAEYVLEKCLVNKKDISCGKEKMPIPCVNYYDESMPPACEYSAERIPTEGVPLNLDEEFLCGCDCEDDCSDKTKCACWQLTYAGAKYGMPTVPIDMVGYQYKRLYEHVPTGIYECNSRCKCKASCVNRVVQQPLQSKLQVFKTSNRGWGLRCINDVPRGSFICVYAGQMLTEQVANEGGLDAGDEYFAELDYIEVAEQIKEGYESDVQEPEEDEDLYNPERDDDDIDFRVPGESFKDKEFNTRLRARRGNKNSTDGEFDSQERQVISFEPNKNMDTSNEPNEKPTIRKLFGKDESCYVMDAKVRGNLGRYFNHSCSPNLFVQNVFVDTHDLRFPWVAFFASTHIRAGTELTWNYNYEVGVVPGKVLYCQCGAPNCRQRLL